MFASRVGVSTVAPRRLDADFYRPDFLAVEAKMREIGACELGRVGHFFAGPFGSLLPSNLYLDQGIPLFRVGNVGQFEVLTENFAHLAPEVHDELKTSEVRPGDLLVVKASVGEKICRVPEWIPKANITQHIIGIRPNGVFDIDYISAFLYSYYGVSQLQRYSLGSIIQYLGITDAKSVLIPEVNLEVQRYIGEKVRQADELRLRAAQLQREVIDLFQADFRWNPAVLSVPNHGRVGVAELESRLDLKFNSPRRLAAIRHARSVGSNLQSLESLVDISAMIGWKGLTTEHYKTVGPWLLRGVEFRNGVIATEELVCIDEEKYAEQPQIHLEEGDIALTKDGTIGKAVVVPRLRNRIAAGSTVARLRRRASLDIDPYYLEYVIGHDFVQCQIESFATGVAQPHITQEWIALLQIPRVSCEEDISGKWRDHHECLSLAKGLTVAAKMLVEGLIEGKADAHLLSTAERALANGEVVVDRTILSRLHVDGFDGDGALLFDDLSRLHELLGAAGVE